MEKTISKADIRVTSKALIIVFLIFAIGIEALIGYGYGFRYFLSDWYLPLGVFVGIMLPCMLRYMRDIYVSNRCHLELTSSRIKGIRKKLFSSEELDLPIDKIDSILVSSTLGDKLEGGKTLLIRSVSGVVKFPWVQNASEFKDAVVTSIDNHK